MIMPYGKFKGQDMENVPSRYLHWLAENIDEGDPRNSAVCLAADKEYQLREKTNTHIE